MSVWCHYLITEDNPVTLDDIEAALRTVNRKFYVDADLILKKPTAEAEPNYEDNSQDLECGQITFAEFDSGLSEEDEPQFYEWAEKANRRDELENLFSRAKSMVTVQVINGGGDGGIYEESLAPLWDWFLQHRQGVLVTDAGEFYSK